MKKILKEKIKKIIRGERYNSDSYISYLRNIGVKIGEDCIIYVPEKTIIDEQYPWLITIGNNVRITEGVKILTHDFSWSVLKSYYGLILGASGCVKIGNNVFIGMSSIITCGVEIGDNVIIGAGSVVTSNCEADSVYAGVPAKKIMSIEDFKKKREEKQLEEAVQLWREYFKRYGKMGGPEIFHEYFMLFETFESIGEKKSFLEKLRLCDNEATSLKYMKEHSPRFRNYEEFVAYCSERSK